MIPVQFEKISIFKLSSGQVLGFHNENLEVAHLSSELWNALQKEESSEELMELKAWSDSVNENVQRSSNDQKVKTLTLNTTQLCNLKCTYCAAGGDGTYGSPLVKLDLKKGLPQLEWLMSRCLPGERFQINFLGGEPLLYPEVIRAVAEHAKTLAEKAEVALRFAVVTNGTRLADQKILDLLLEYRVAVTVSVDGPPEIQDHFRPQKNGQGSSRELEKGLHSLREIKNRLPSVGLAAVFHKDHVAVLDTYKYFLKWDFDYYELNYSHTDFDAQASQDFSLGMQAVAEYADSQGGEDSLRKIRTFDGIFQRLDDQVRLVNFCGSGKSLLSMDAKGDLYACPWDINEKGLKLNSGTNVSSEKLEDYQSPQNEKNLCRQCWARYACGGGCNYTHKKSSGNSQKVDPIFCDRTQSLILTSLMYYEKYRRSSDETH